MEFLLAIVVVFGVVAGAAVFADFLSIALMYGIFAAFERWFSPPGARASRGRGPRS